MLNATSLPARIEIYAIWYGFEWPPEGSSQLILRPEESGDWAAFDEMTLVQCNVPRERIVRFMAAINDVATEPEPIRFGRTADELDWHFRGCRTDGSLTILVELHFDDRELLRMRTSSNHVQLLPWTLEINDRFDNFNPEISMALTALVPDGWLFKERLQTSDPIFDSEAEMRAEVAKHCQERVDRPDETLEQHQARVDAMMKELGHKWAHISAHGEEVVFSQDKRDYTANQLRTLSTAQLSELAAEGFNLSTADETGQTALMLAASPPFNQAQFEKLVAVGADVNARRADSATGLMQACAGGMEDTVPFWLNAGADVNLRGPNGCTAIMLGAKYPKIVQNLLQCGADVAAADHDGDTALDYVIYHQNVTLAGRRLQSIEILAREIGQVDLPSLKRSLMQAIEVARKTRVHHRVLMKLGLHPISENIVQARKSADQSESWQEILRDMDHFIDLEINEIELADRIVACLREVLAEAEPDSSSGEG